jgi:hypothetical protein
MKIEAELSGAADGSMTAPTMARTTVIGTAPPTVLRTALPMAWLTVLTTALHR